MFSTAFHIFYGCIGDFNFAKHSRMTQEELISLHDHLVGHYNDHGAEEARQQIAALEDLLLSQSRGMLPSGTPIVTPVVLTRHGGDFAREAQWEGGSNERA